TTKNRIPLADALLVANGLRTNLAPSSEYMVIAGSIRRRRPDIGDIELLYVPRFEPIGQSNLFGKMEMADLVDVELRRMMTQGVLGKRLNVNGNPIGYGDRNKALVHVASGIGVDIFSTTAEYWGMALVVRTGPAEWNQAMMTAFLRRGMQGHAYAGVSRGGKEIECPTEESVFALLGLPYLEPWERTPERLQEARLAVPKMR
ncbi:MAG: hypothetical protein Q8R28_18830, partial [Dehalococcoidia bacterium]|nr:hypothetical protein [Dehalococcoidia bacterium]